MDGIAPIACLETIVPGAEVSLSKRITAEEVDAFAKLSGDRNPLHVDEEFARRTVFRRRVAHGILSAAYVSTLVGMHLPGAGALWTQQNFDFLAPVFLGDEILFRVRVEHKSVATRTLKIRVEATNQHGKRVMHGNGTVMLLEPKLENGTGQPKHSVALVTGSARGIGAAIAGALAAQGASVVVNYRVNAVRALEQVALLTQTGARALAIQADVADSQAVTAMVRQAEDAFGQSVDILVNNASGPLRAKSFLQAEWHDFQDHFNVLVQGAYQCSRAVLPGMVERKFGCIVNVGSIATWGSPPANMAAYTVAKSGLGAMTRCLAAEFGPRGVRVNLVSPGMVETELVDEVPERARKVLAMQTPLRRLASPSDVAEVVAMLCSPAGSFIHGADLPVCGGIAM